MSEGPTPHPGFFDHPAVVALGRRLLVAIGEDPDRPDLVDTPGRWADAWWEFVAFDPGKLNTSFPTAAGGSLVVVGPVRVWSVCEHHLMPFGCDVWVGVVPGGEVLGLSKYARIVFERAHRLQIQERLTSEVAASVATFAGTGDVAVLGRGEHLCVSMRGVGAPAPMTTLETRGRFRTDPPLRADFLSLCGR